MQIYYPKQYEEVSANKENLIEKKSDIFGRNIWALFCCLQQQVNLGPKRQTLLPV